MLIALRHRNFRIFFIGQSISLIGTWMQQIALSWLVYHMTNSAVLLGVVGFSSQITTFILAPFAGVIADRYHKHRLLLITQTAAMLQAVVLSILVFTHTIAVWQIIFLSLILGVINAFDIPVRQAFTVQMIDHPEDLGNAIALNSSMVNTARFLGPSLGGLLIAVAGEGMCFLFNAISYVAVLVSLLMMNITHRSSGMAKKSIIMELKDGFYYTFGFLPIRAILVLLSVASFVSGGSQVLMPVFAKDIFHGGAHTLGLLMGVSGLGALSGALYLASRKSVRGLGRVIVSTCILFGAGLISFSMLPSIWLSMTALFLAGFGVMVQMAASNTVLQTMVDEDKRGRVMSFYTMAFMGMSPFGSLLAGNIAEQWGPQCVLFWGGLLVIIASILFAMGLPRIRQLVQPLHI